MGEAEEKLLDGYFQDVSLHAEEIQDIKLDTAIRSGILRGSYKNSTLRINFTVALIAGLAAFLFIIVPWIRESVEPERAQIPPKSWGELEVFRPIVENNITLKSALDAGLVQIIGVTSEEKNDYTFTLNGVVADDKGMFVLLTVQNNSNQKLQLNGILLQNMQGEDIYYSSNEASWSETDGGPGVTHKYIKFLWNEDQKETQFVANLMVIPDTPEAMLSSSDRFRTSLAVPFTVDANLSRPTDETIPINQKLMIGKQTIDIKQAYIRPTGIYIDMAYDKYNTMRIFELSSPKIILGKDSRLLVLNSYQKENNKMLGIETLIFENDNLNSNRRMTLEIEGIHAMERSKLELIVDIEKRKIIKAPDNRLAISDQIVAEKQGIMVLTMFTPKEQMYIPNIGHRISIDGNFADGTGSGHWMVLDNNSMNSESREDETGITTTYFYNLGWEMLPQPLTFRLDYYPNHIEETASIRIK